MKRREFPRSVKVAVVKRATRDGIIYCEKCTAQAKKWQIDQIIADAIGGDPVLSNAELICDACYGAKNPADTRLAAKAKRREAGALGVRKPASHPIAKPPKQEKPKRDQLDMPPRRNLYMEVT